MSNTMNRIASDLQKIMSESDKKKTSGFDTQAVVTRLDGNTAWVKFPGGEDETPVRRTTNAGVGDNVQVRVNGGRAWLLGNVTNPPTDDTQANIATETAKNADRKAADAIDNASIAKIAADSAEKSATEAKAYAEQAKETTDEINAYAEVAGKTVTQILQDGETAGEKAQEAIESAKTATSYANGALAQLGVVEDVVGTLTWLSEHAEFSLTEDTEVDTSKQYYEALWGYFPTEDTEIDQSKTYYERSGEGTDEDPYVYTVVSSPSIEHLSEYYEYKFTGYEPVLLSEDDSPTGYYEITSIDEAVTNFIGTHLALTEQGLWVTADADNDYKVLVASDGVYIYGPSGQISKFGEDIEFSSLRPQHIGGEDTYIEFNPSTNKLNIVADDIVIGGKNALERIETFENTVPAIQDALTSQAQSIHTQQESLDILTGYVDISPTQSRIRVGDKTSTSYVEISGKSDDLRVSINIDGKDVAYMAHNRFYAPSAVVSNLYMQTELSGDNPIGAIGWVMRSNGHLSLKRIK